MSSVADWEVVASQENADTDTTLTPSDATSARFVLVYLTELPEVETARYRSEITGLVVNG